MIRTAVVADLPELQRVFRDASLSNADDAPLLQAHPEYLAFAGGRILQGSTRVATLGEGADRVLGFATVVADDNGGLELEDLFVDPAWHRRGIARALVVDAVDTARAAGHQFLSVIGNPHALAFYRALGFVEVGPAVTELGTGLRLRLPLDQHRTSPLRLSGPIGLGCMNLSHAYGTAPSAAEAERLLLAALDAGVTLFDTAALYGFGANEQLVGRVLAPHRDRVVLASKCGMTGVDGRRVIDGRPETLLRTADEALARLGTDVIDLYYLHRVDRDVPVEESVGALASLVEAGKIRAIGLSEVSATTLRRAHAVHPVAALQNEYSLWSRNPELGTLRACRELGIALVAFSPLGRGFLTSAPPDPITLPQNDIRRAMPRFTPENYATNLALRAELDAVARGVGCTLAQLALAWVLSRGEHVIAIPGTRSVEHLRENLATLDAPVPAEALEAAGRILGSDTVAGARYAPATLTEIDTESFAKAG